MKACWMADLYSCMSEQLTSLLSGSQGSLQPNLEHPTVDIRVLVEDLGDFGEVFCEGEIQDEVD